MNINYMISNPFILIALSIVLGFLVSFVCSISMVCSKTMRYSLILLPALVTAALLAVNGSLGTSIAVLGIFGLVRFRSAPGNAKDIVSVFYAMVIGLLVSTGYIVISVVISIILGIAIVGASHLFLNDESTHTLKILVPENLNFDEIFDSILDKYFASKELVRVKSTEMGTLFELSYEVVPAKEFHLKECLDEIRTHNGNLNVIYTKSKNNNEL